MEINYMKEILKMVNMKENNDKKMNNIEINQLLKFINIY